MFKKKQIVGTLLLLSLSIQTAIAEDKTVVKATIGGAQKSLSNGMTVNSDGSITVSGSGGNNTKTPVSNPTINKSGLSLSKERTDSPSVKAFDNRNESLNNDGAFVVEGGNSGAEKLKQLNSGASGKVGGVQATIGEATTTPVNNGDVNASVGQTQPAQEAPSKYEYQGGVGKAERTGSAGVLFFQGGDKNAGRYTVNNDNNNTSTPTLKSFEEKERTQIPASLPVLPPEIKTPVSVKNMPLPSSLPPLPGNSASNGIALPIALPTSEASALPPLPMDFIPNLNIQVGMPGDLSNKNGVPVNSNGEPINYSGLSNEAPTEDYSGVDDGWTAVMQDEADAMTLAGIPMKIVVVNTQNTLMRKFIAQNILKTDKETFDGTDEGLSSVLSLQTKVNSSYIPTCYIMFRKESLTALKNNVLNPYSNAIGKKATASFLVGHQIAHCMDNLERYKVLPKQSVWFANDATKVGIAAPTMRRLYPYGMNYNQFSHTTMHFYQDIGQRQYQERIADIFGVFMTLYRGYSDKIIDLVMQSHSDVSPTSAHDTNPALNGIKAKYSAIPKTSVQALWKGARDIQVMVGINNALGDGAPDSVVKDNSMSSGKIYDNIKAEKAKNKKEDKKPKKINFDNTGKFEDNKNTPSKLFGSSQISDIK